MLEPYTPTRQRPTAIGATALKTGVIQLTASAFRELGETEFAPFYSPHTHQPHHQGERPMTTKTKTLTDPDGDKLIIYGYPGALAITIQQSLTGATVRSIDPAELIAAIREVAGMDDATKPDPAREYTADDFAQADFARHPDGRIAARIDDDSPEWRTSDRSPSPWRSDAEMAAGGWQIVTPAPTTARDLLAMLPDLCYEPEDGRIPKGTGFIEVWSGGSVFVVPRGYNFEVSDHGTGFHRLLLDPPAPVTPEWHSARIVEARALGGGHCQWASTTDGMWVSLDGGNFPVHRNYLADVKVIVPEGGAS